MKIKLGKMELLIIILFCNYIYCSIEIAKIVCFHVSYNMNMSNGHFKNTSSKKIQQNMKIRIKLKNYVRNLLKNRSHCIFTHIDPNGMEMDSLRKTDATIALKPVNIFTIF